MKKNIIFGLVCMLLVGCSKPTTASIKEKYEKVNGQEFHEKTNREITLQEDSPFIETTAEDINKKFTDQETFFVYYGDELCPWCRSVIEVAEQSALDHNVTVYVVNLWDEEGNELLRDTYSLEEGKLVQTSKGSDAYREALKNYHDVLSDYSIKDENGTLYDTGEKRIFAPNFIYVKEGKAIAMMEGISSLQEDSREELSQEIKDDEKKMFDSFFAQ